jgi:hypothetical protein
MIAARIGTKIGAPARAAGRWRRAGLLAAALAGASAPAAGATGIERLPPVDACAAAATFAPDDLGPAAAQARRRCRLEMFEQRLQAERVQREAAQSDWEDRAVQTWMQKQGVPARVLRRNAVDLFGSGGLVSYGLAVAGVLLPSLEAEVWVGRKEASSGSDNWSADDTRNCIGGRFKWLLLKHGDLTPFASGGVAFCSATLTGAYGSGPPDLLGNGSSSDGGGNATAHLATAGVGLTWTDKSGFRASIEYVYAYAFYTQAQTDDPMKTEDQNLRDGWTQRLKSERHGARFQVGYAF